MIKHWLYSVPRCLISRHTTVHGSSILRNRPIHIDFGKIPAQTREVTMCNISAPNYRGQKKKRTY